MTHVGIERLTARDAEDDGAEQQKAVKTMGAEKANGVIEFAPRFSIIRFGLIACGIASLAAAA